MNEKVKDDSYFLLLKVLKCMVYWPALEAEPHKASDSTSRLESPTAYAFRKKSLNDPWTLIDYSACFLTVPSVV